MVVIATEFIPLSLLNHCFGDGFGDGLCGKAASGLERILHRVLEKWNGREAWIGALVAVIEMKLCLNKNIVKQSTDQSTTKRDQ